MSDLDPLAAPTLVLRGKSYRLPELELKQVIPISARLLKLRGIDYMSEEWLTLVFDIVYVTLVFVDPSVSREDYERNPPSYPELIDAFPVITKQARFSRVSKDEPPGEAQAGS